MRMKLLIVAMLLICTNAYARDMSRGEEPDELGLVMQGRTYFPVPAGVRQISVQNPGFEGDAAASVKGWILVGGKVITEAADAPEGKNFVRLHPGKPARVISPSFELDENKTFLVSFWLRSEATVGIRVDGNGDPTVAGRTVYRNVPPTGGEWKRVGVHIRVAATTTEGKFWLTFEDRDASHQPVDFDELTVRTTTWPEYRAAHQAWRETFDPWDITPRPDDGKNLALSIRKLQGQGVPGKPFVIWALGSSYTNFLGNGETILYELYKRFPNAPEIVYKKHVGSSVPWQYVRGWAMQFAISEQPDLFLIYVHDGGHEHLEKMLKYIRSHSTADIVVPSLHLRKVDGMNEKAVDGPGWQKAREICARYGVEFVENRKEWAEYFKKTGKTVADLNLDNVHQNTRGALLINENIVRHFAGNAEPSYDPTGRERRLRLLDLFNNKTDKLVVAGTVGAGDDATLKLTEKDSALKFSFTGNRIDLIALGTPASGSARIRIDGRPADEIDAFFTTFIQPGPQNVGQPFQRGDRSPHGILLGTGIVPQDWTIAMLDDDGNYEITGSVTGPDGRGSVFDAFTSKSGQIVVDPELWRGNSVKKGERKAANKKGDTFTFRVYRTGIGSVNFKRDKRGLFHLPLVMNLPNGAHEVEIVADGNGELLLDSLYVYEPPLKGE